MEIPPSVQANPKAHETPADTRAVSITEYPDSHVRLEAGDESLNLSEAEFAILKSALISHCQGRGKS